MSEISVFVRVFGETPFITVVDTLLDHPTYDYTKTELAEVNDISRPTLYRIWDRLEALDIVEETRKIGNSQLYRLNTDSKLVKKLVSFEKEIEDDSEIRGLLAKLGSAAESTA